MYQGTIERVEQDKYKVSGLLEKINENTIEITELPVRRWTQDFKEMLEDFATGSEKVPQTVKVKLRQSCAASELNIPCRITRNIIPTQPSTSGFT